MTIPPTDETDDNVCANNNRIAITLNISLSINGVKYGVCGSKDDASTDNNNEHGNKGKEKEDGSDDSIKSLRICTKANPSLSLTIRNGEVCMANSDSSDRFQYWYKHEKYGASVKDAEGNPSFVIVNKATTQAIQIAAHNQFVKLITFNKNQIDKSVLWTSKVMDASYMYIRNTNDISLLFDAANPKLEGIRDGTRIIACRCLHGGPNQLWKFVPFG